MNRKDLILIGGGGHAKSCIDVIEAEGRFKIAGIVDVEGKINQKTAGYKIIAGDKDLPVLVKKFKYFFITIGSIKDPLARIEKFKYLKELGAEFPVIVSPSAHVSRSACVGEGTIVMHQAVVNTEAIIGQNCIINTGSIIEHEAQVGDHSHVSTGSIVNGRSRIGKRVFLGSNSTVIQDIDIVDDAIIGAGTVIRKNINRAGVYAGNLARRR